MIIMTQEPGIHVIMLDARSGRDPTHAEHGSCLGGATRYSKVRVKQKQNLSKTNKPPLLMGQRHQNSCETSSQEGVLYTVANLVIGNLFLLFIFPTATDGIV